MIRAFAILKKSQTRPPALSGALCCHFASLSNAPCSMFPAFCSQLLFSALSSLLCPQLPALCSYEPMSLMSQLSQRENASCSLLSAGSGEKGCMELITFLTYRLCRCRQDRPPSKMHRAPLQLVFCPSPPSQTSFPLVLAIPTYPNPMLQSVI